MAYQLFRVGLELRPAEGRTSDQQLIERAAQRIDVGPKVDGVGVRSLFRGHVVGRAHDLTQRGQLAAGGLIGAEQGQPKVENLDLSLACHHQVRGLDVPMHQAVLVGVLEPEGRLADELAGSGNPQPFHALEQFADVFSINIVPGNRPQPAAKAGVWPFPAEPLTVSRHGGKDLLADIGGVLRLETALPAPPINQGRVDRDQPPPGLRSRACTRSSRLLEVELAVTAPGRFGGIGVVYHVDWVEIAFCQADLFPPAQPLEQYAPT